jgi:TRAP-type C4-dicarboxylate transport system permease small subunit
MEKISQYFAIAGGLILLALMAMSLVSIVGRKLFSLPVRGDMELVEMGAAIAIASFLPLCELRGLHIKADAFTLALSETKKTILDMLGHLLCCFAALVLAWRCTIQMQDYHEFGDVSTLLSVPLWIPMMFIIPSMLLLAACALTRIVTLSASLRRVS